MQELSQKPIIGLLGGPGAGKSAVAAAFGQLGCAVSNADELNHEVLRRPEIIARIAGIWGEQVLEPDGQINRKVLGNIVFNDKSKLAMLTALVHPPIRLIQQARIAQWQADPAVKAIILDVPLLVETGQQGDCDFLVFVDCGPEIRARRVRQSKGWEPGKLVQVEKIQISLEKKRKIADYIVDNSREIPHTARQVETLLDQIIKK